MRREDLLEQLRDVDAVLDRRVELETKVGRELEVLKPASELVADQAFGRDQPLDRGILLIGIAEHAHPDAGLAQIRRHADRGDADEPDPRILQIAPDDGHDLFAHLFAHLVRAGAGPALEELLLASEKLDPASTADLALHDAATGDDADARDLDRGDDLDLAFADLTVRRLAQALGRALDVLCQLVDDVVVADLDLGALG